MSRLKQRAKKALTVADDIKDKLGHKAKAVLDKGAYKAKKVVNKVKNKI